VQQAPRFWMAPGQGPLDALLAHKEPIHDREEFRLPDFIQRDFLGERRLGEAPGGREFAAWRQKALADEGHRKIPLSRGRRVRHENSSTTLWHAFLLEDVIAQDARTTLATPNRQEEARSHIDSCSLARRAQ